MAKQKERIYTLYAFEKALADIFKFPEDGTPRDIDKIINCSNGKSKKYLKELKRLVDKNGVDAIATWGFIQNCKSVELLKDIYAVMTSNDNILINPETGKFLRQTEK